MGLRKKRRYRQIMKIDENNYENYLSPLQNKLSRYIEKKFKLIANKEKYIDLSYMNLEEYSLNIDHLKIKTLQTEHIEANQYIYNEYQKALEIHNSNQQANDIYNDRQSAIYIYNYEQTGKKLINNEDQKAMKKKA